jgi:anthranilate synthase component 1
MVTPTQAEFVERSQRGNLVPVYREILADLETPVSAFLKVGGQPHSFLLESVAGGEQISRYSFIGGDTFMVLKTKGRELEITREGRTERRELEDGEDPLHVLKGILAGFQFVKDPELPPFCGGAVGYIGYDAVRFFERLPDLKPDDRGLPDCYFALTDTLLIFDHVKHRIKVLCLARVGEDAEAAYTDAVEKIDRLAAQLRQPLPHPEPVSRPDAADGALTVRSIPSREEHEAAVLRAKEYIAAGDIIQVVISRRMEVDVASSPFQIYRALRSINPSPYMFFLQFEDCQLIGASPEILVTERAGQVVTRPIAGTVRRGKTREEDAELEAQLLADPKERAEHIMLVDLHRNDIGRVCKYGTVHVDQLMVTEKYSHVIHIVSNVVGELRPEKDAYDLIRATFPAGTLSGAPKIRAMEIIEELEPVKRGPYGGCIGYFSFSGDMDTAITLRTIVMKGQTAYVQAGGGIVADSDPEAEYQETVNKAGALMRAIEFAERGLA